MATIPNFPQPLLSEHAAWHRNMRMGMQMRSGDGTDFLEFHRNFLQKSLVWYRSQRLNPRLVEPWSSIPLEIKNHPRWNRRLQDAENRITRSLASFNSSDELGGFILASSLHDLIHVIGAEVFNDDDFGQISLAPRSTLFYNWHGLIDNWWRQLEQ
jgi:hypothetical protein